MDVGSVQLKELRERCLPLEQAILSGNSSGARYLMNSPLLFRLLASYSVEQYYQILDLIPANRNTIDYFSCLHCKLYLPGCHSLLRTMSLETLDTEHKQNRALIKMLGLKKQDKARLDLILLWDLPNYLDGKMLRVFIDYILPHCSEETRVHTYVHTREQMPDTPAMFSLHADEKISVQQNSSVKTSSPMFYQESLQKTLSPFVVERGMLLSNGLQEYLLKHS